MSGRGEQMTETSLLLGTKVRIRSNDHGIEPGTVGTYRTPALRKDHSVIEVLGHGRVHLASDEFEVVEDQDGRGWRDVGVDEPAITPVVEPAAPPTSSSQNSSTRSVADRPASRGPLPKSLSWARDWSGFEIEPYVVAEDAMALLGISRPTLGQYYDILGWDCCEKKGCRFCGRHLAEIRELEELRQDLLGIPIAAAVRVRNRLRAAMAGKETQ